MSTDNIRETEIIMQVADHHVNCLWYVLHPAANQNAHRDQIVSDTVRELIKPLVVDKLNLSVLALLKLRLFPEVRHRITLIEMAGIGSKEKWTDACVAAWKPWFIEVLTDMVNADDDFLAAYREYVSRGYYPFMPLTDKKNREWFASTMDEEREDDYEYYDLNEITEHVPAVKKFELPAVLRMYPDKEEALRNFRTVHQLKGTPNEEAFDRGNPFLTSGDFPHSSSVLCPIMNKDMASWSDLSEPAVEIDTAARELDLILSSQGGFLRDVGPEILRMFLLIQNGWQVPKRERTWTPEVVFPMPALAVLSTALSTDFLAPHAVRVIGMRLHVRVPHSWQGKYITLSNCAVPRLYKVKWHLLTPIVEAKDKDYLWISFSKHSLYPSTHLVCYDENFELIGALTFCNMAEIRYNLSAYAHQLGIFRNYNLGFVDEKTCLFPNMMQCHPTNYQGWKRMNLVPMLDTITGRGSLYPALTVMGCMLGSLVIRFSKSQTLRAQPAYVPKISFYDFRDGKTVQIESFPEVRNFVSTRHTPYFVDSNRTYKDSYYCNGMSLLVPHVEVKILNDLFAESLRHTAMYLLGPFRKKPFWKGVRHLIHYTHDQEIDSVRAHWVLYVASWGLQRGVWEDEEEAGRYAAKAFESNRKNNSDFFEKNLTSYFTHDEKQEYREYQRSLAEYNEQVRKDKEDYERMLVEEYEVEEREASEEQYENEHGDLNASSEGGGEDSGSVDSMDLAEI